MNPLVQAPQAAPRKALPPRAPRRSIQRLYERWGQPARVRAKTSHGQRARMIMVQSLAGFFLVQAAFGLLVVAREQAWRDPIFHTRLAKLREDHQRHPDRPIVAFVGSSRLLYGLDQGALERLARENAADIVTANFAVHGGGPCTELIMTRRLFRAGIRPGLLVIELVPSLLDVRDMPDDLERHRMATERLVHDDVGVIERYAEASRSDVRGEWWWGWVVPVYTHRFALVSVLCPRLLPLQQRTDADQAFVDLTNGRSPLSRLSVQQKQRWLAQAEREHRHRLTNVQRQSLAGQALRELAELCRQQGIAVTVVLTPEGPAFQSWYSGPSREETRQVIAMLREEFGFTVVDAQHWLADERWFADSHHLLPEAGLTFTERLWREVVGPLAFSGRRALAER